MTLRNRFLMPKAHNRAHRIALSCTAQFPDPQQAGVYAEFAAFRDVLNAEIVVPHSQVSVSGRLPAELAWLDASSVFIRPNADVHRADYEHFRRTMPARFDATMTRLSDAIGCSREALDDRFEVHHACTYARLMRALEVDYIHTWYNYDQSLNAAVTSMLLGIPRGLTLCEGFDGDDWDLRVPSLHLEQADVVVAVSDDTAATVQRVGGDPAASKCVRTSGPAAPREIAARIDEAVARSTPLPRGVDAAYRESDARSRDLASGVVPFILLATERTGSNLLFEVLALQSFHELFNPDYRADGFVPIYFNPELQRDPELVRLREQDRPALLDRVWQVGADAGFSAMGLKLMYFHGDIDYDVTDYLLNSHDLRVFHVRRENRLSRYVSFERAQVSGSWYKTRRMGGKGGPKGAIEIDVEQMLADFYEQELLEEKYAALFRNHAMMDVTYESFSADFDKTRRDARRLLGVDLLDTPVHSRKTGKRTMRAAIANVDAVEATLRGTRFEAFLDQP